MKFSVLIVEDEKNIREGLGKALEMDGYSVTLAENGREALRIMERQEMDLILTDLRMPELSGEEQIGRAHV